MENQSLAKRFGLVVRELRTAKGYSQEGFADHVGIHRTYMGSIERGEKVVSIDTVAKIAVALNIKISELFQALEGR